MPQFCVDCGTQLEDRQAFGQTRGVCPACGHVHFIDPKVAVGVVVELDGGIVLGKRAHEPNLGRWSFPSGFVDVGEILEEAAAREVEEETGLKVSIDRLLGVYSTNGERTVFVAYAGSVIGGRLEAGEECFEVASFPPNELPELAFPHDDAIVATWASGAGTPISTGAAPPDSHTSSAMA
ncbi:MAG TPA: NUDIX domain-containing protein [Dehalococcoidia bacterium]|nr:NUDIX domain-containing protein [Dehalococcoidia bacterium]